MQGTDQRADNKRGNERLVEQAPPKPLLRGWFHAVATAGAVAVTVGLLARTITDLPRFVSVLVFGLSMIVLYAVSSIYHIGRWQGRPRRVLRTLDHANIFLLIAGTYTPICVIVLSGHLRTALLVVIWSLAAAGVGGAVLTLRMPRWLQAGLYLAMGWIAVVPMPALIRALPFEAMAWLLAGGLLYTVGGVVYALQRPNPLPRVLGFHEIFHLFVIAGSAAFTVVIWSWVVPFSHG